MKLQTPFAYLKSHWRGQHRLLIAVVVNLIGLRLVMTFIQPAVTTQLMQSWTPVVIFGLGALASCWIFIWQSVGALRAGERHIRALGSITGLWGAQIAILLVFWLTVSDLWALWIDTHPVIKTENFAERMDREHASKYQLSLSDDNKAILFNGEIALGSTKAMKALVAANPEVEVLVLTSEGGNIYEARGLAALLKEFKIDTRVEAICSSACTLAFIGGVQRSVPQGAKLGFHQYRVSADYEVPFANPAKEQDRDRALFLAAGVSGDFVSRMFSADVGGMWFPELEELAKAGVLTQP